MNDLKKFGAIDIGSNAVRFLFSHVVETIHEPLFKKTSLVRLPIRLGSDVFETGKISERNIQRLIKTLHSFKYLADVYEILDYQACATAAMREAANGPEVAELLKKETGISVEIIDGSREAEIIYNTHIAEHLPPGKVYLYIDVGGGSTEMSIFTGEAFIESRSFNVGTVRMLTGKVSQENLHEMISWLKTLSSRFKIYAGIGSGGNINRTFKMTNVKPGQPLTILRIETIFEDIKSYSVEERINILGLNPDRADVIIPALEIFLLIMEHTGIRKIFVPKVGLADGIVRLLYEKHSSSSV